MRSIACDKDMYRSGNDMIQGRPNSRLFSRDAAVTVIRLDGL